MIAQLSHRSPAIARLLCASASRYRRSENIVVEAPAFEPIVLARKPLSEPTVAANVLRWRTGALNIGACRVEAAQGDAPVSWESPRGGIWRTDAAASAQLVTTGQGRWPANVVLTYPDISFTVNANATDAQRAEIEAWLVANTEHEMRPV